MKKILILILILTGCTTQVKKIRRSVSLAGEWGFMIDSLDRGIKESWFNIPFTDSVKLPGSMAENGKGDEVKVNTQWTGDIVDRSYFTDKKYEKYRQPGNIKIPKGLHGTGKNSSCQLILQVSASPFSSKDATGRQLFS